MLGPVYCGAVLCVPTFVHMRLVKVDSWEGTQKRMCN